MRKGHNIARRRPERDMATRQFDAECARRGFLPLGFLGYYRLGDTGMEVSILNAGTWRRDQLAYLIRQHERYARAACRPERENTEAPCRS